MLANIMRRDREAMLGLPRADAFRPSHQPFVDGPDALYTGSDQCFHYLYPDGVVIS